MTILVVEDEALLLAEIADALAAAGFSVLGSSSADKAVRLLEHHPEIRLVVSDVRMPGKLDGIGLARHVRSKPARIPVILVSGEVNAGDLPDVADMKLPKPVDIVELVAAIAALLPKRAV